MRFSALIWWWFGCWAAIQGEFAERSTAKQPGSAHRSRPLFLPLESERAPGRQAGMDTELPGKRVKAVFPFSPQEKNSFSDVFVVGAYFCHGVEETSPPDFPAFLGISSPKLKASTVHSQTLPSPSSPQEHKQENSGACRVPHWAGSCLGFPQRSSESPCQELMFGGLFLVAVRDSSRLNFCTGLSAQQDRAGTEDAPCIGVLSSC